MSTTAAPPSVPKPTPGRRPRGAGLLSPEELRFQLDENRGKAS
ncbi:hypothetical protein [Pseudonocardia adelaidensis]